MQDIIIKGSKTFKRSAYVNRNSKGYYVSLTDWTTRQGGSYDSLNLDQAIGIGQEFINGCSYHFDSERGIVLK